MKNTENIELPTQLDGEMPYFLVDHYLDFNDFSRIEFLIFRDRLSSAILVSNAAKKAIAEKETILKAQQESGSHRIAGWEEESDLILTENIGILEEAYRISIGATIVTTVAALESLLIDITPDAEPRPNGLHRLFLAFLKRYQVPKDRAKYLTDMESNVGKIRNTFAHTLTGSYFAKDKSSQALFTPETMDETLFTVCEIALVMEEIVLANETPDNTQQ